MRLALKAIVSYKDNAIRHRPHDSDKTVRYIEVPTLNITRSKFGTRGERRLKPDESSNQSGFLATAEIKVWPVMRDAQ